MRFSLAVTAAFAAGATASSNYSVTAYVTEVLSSYETYCSEPTQVTYNGQTYPVTEATTLTITNCPCTVIKPVVSSVVTSCSTSSTPAPIATAPTPAPYSNGTSYSAPATPVSPVGTGVATTVAPIATFTGAANKAFAASGAGLAAVFGLAAYIL